MYLRTAKRSNKDGSVVVYYQLAHNERDPISRRPVAKIIHNFGRADKLDRDDLVRLCRSIARVCDLEIVDPLGDSQLPLFAAPGLPLDLKLYRIRLRCPASGGNPLGETRHWGTGPFHLPKEIAACSL